MYSLNLYSTNNNKIDKFLKHFYNTDEIINNNWDYSVHNNNESIIYLYIKKTTNPLDFVVLIGVLIDNLDKYNIFIWLSLDNGAYINITSSNVNEIIKYIYERFPY